MAATRKTVELFYDVVSPYSWIGFEVMTRYAQRWNIDLKLKPFFLGGIMQGASNRPPAMVPAKGRYMAKDIDRVCLYYDIPLRHPKNFTEMAMEKGTLNSQRFLTAVDLTYPRKLEEVSRQLWFRIWHKDVDATTPESLREAGVAAGLTEGEVNECLSKVKDAAVKDKLKANTAEALENGAFGAPTIIAHVDGKKELFFGSDRFPQLAQLLGERYEGPLNHLNKSKL